jgi:transposase-like protein
MSLPPSVLNFRISRKLPKCPQCGRSDYAPVYDKHWRRTGERVCLRCGKRWTDQEERT